MKLLILLAIFFTSSSKSEGVFIQIPSQVYRSEGKVDFVVDCSRFLRSDSITVCEFSYMINLNSLKKKDNLMGFMAKVEIRGSNLKNPIISQWTQRTTKPLNFSIDKFWASLVPGNYEINFTVSDLNSKSKGSVKFSVNTLEVDTSLSASDLQLLLTSYPGEDTVFGKFGYVQIPNPSGIYYSGKDTLYFYLELYHLGKDTIPYFVRYFILDEKGSLVRASSPIKRGRDELPVIRDGILLEGLKSGRYTLKVQAVDPSTGNSVIRDREFIYYSSELTAQGEAENLTYFYFIDYFATPEELREFRELPDEGKLLFLKKFWKKFDPTPNTEYNEFFVEFVKRCKYADENFSLPEKPGRLTDRGRIYIKFGPPDEVNRVTFGLTSRNREHWLYYSGGFKEFVFVDIKNTGDYELVYSSDPSEPSKPDWMKYVSPSDLQRQSF